MPHPPLARRRAPPLAPILTLALALSGLAAAPPARAQQADQQWQTLETAHYRLHTPEQARPWADYVAQRLEEIRARVQAEVGPGPTRKIDVVVMDPDRQPNGFALPLSHHPRMGLFPTAPTASTGLAWNRSWAEDLVTHEDTHLVHLMRPSRSPTWRATASLLGIEPVTAGSPSWVIEGYATLVEGRLTGRGRPHGDERAAWLRVLAQDGRLPSYLELNGTGQWMGRSHRYLVGSAYLEWLEKQRCAPTTDVPAPGGCHALQDLWARMTARRIRGFRSAFRGVFGDEPDALYDRFRAQVIHDAVEQQAHRAVDHDLWLDLKGSTGAPALSPDGSRLVAERRFKDHDELVVWETADDPQALSRWLKPHEEDRARDPEDVLPVVPEVLPRSSPRVREDPYRPARSPRFMPDGVHVLTSIWEVEPHGELRPDLFLWDSDNGLERRVTQGQDLQLADPAPDGTWAVAVQRRWGQDALVRVDLETGAVTVIDAPPVPVVLDQPRLDPTGTRLAYLRHDGDWRLVIRDLQTGVEVEPPLPEGASVADPAWSRDGQEILLSLGQRGYIEVFAVPLDGGPPQQLTASRGSATAPEQGPDGSLYHLDLDSDGIDLHRIPTDLTRGAVPPTPGPPPVVPPVNPDPPSPLVPDPASVAPPRPYGLGQTEPMLLAGGYAGPGGSSGELGLRLGDVVGRHEALLLGAWGQGTGTTGASLKLAWHGPPVGAGGTLRLDGFWLTHSPLGQRAGAELGLGQDRAGSHERWSWELGGWTDQPLAADPLGARVSGFGEASGALHVGHLSWADLRGGVHGQLGSLRHRLLEASLGLAGGIRDMDLDLSWTRTIAADGLTVGGMSSSVVPSAMSRGWVPMPGLPVDALSGTHRETWEATLGPLGQGLFASRNLAGTGDASSDVAITLAGLRLRADMPAQPLVRLPAGTVDGGVACRVEDTDGWIDRPCRSLSDWVAWLGLRWGW